MIKWSFSGLKDFVNCPRQFNEVKNLKKFTKEVTSQMLYGTAVHKALEDYTRDGTPLPTNYLRYKHLIDPLLDIEGTKHPELKMALRADKKPCGFDDSDYWVRGIVDFLITAGDTAYIVDYKTGSARYPDAKQLKLMALMTFAHFPEVQHVKAGLLFVAHDMFIPEEYDRSMIDKLWSVFTPDLERLRSAHESGVWNPNPTGLCGWCPVTTCEHYRRR